jgi:hypothetical protein
MIGFNRRRFLWSSAALGVGAGKLSMWQRLAGYGVLLGLGTFLLQFADYQHLVRSHADGIYGFLLAAAFLALGIYVGARLFGADRPAPFDGNPRARAALGLSPRGARLKPARR